MEKQYKEVMLTMDNGEEVHAVVVHTFEIDNVNYAALISVEDDEDDLRVFLFRYNENSDGEVLSDIETDEEYEKAADYFDEWLSALNK